jgi:hypothetical protein
MDVDPDVPLAASAPAVAPPVVPLPVVPPGFVVVPAPGAVFPPVVPAGATELAGAPDPGDRELPELPQATGARSAIQGRNDRLGRTVTIALSSIF